VPGATPGAGLDAERGSVRRGSAGRSVGRAGVGVGVAGSGWQPPNTPTALLSTPIELNTQMNQRGVTTWALYAA